MSALRRFLRSVPGVLPAVRWLRRNLDSQERMIHAPSTRPGSLMLQPRPDTWLDRYPQLFAALASRLDHLPEPRILSFGCSTGQEVRSLRRHIPRAIITGMDINPRSVAEARRADPNPLSRYVVAEKPDPDERYDAILGMAVFRNGLLEAGRPDNCASILSFARFSEGIARLDECLEQGGWLALYNGHFRFSDTRTAQSYACDSFRMTDHPPLTILYGPDDFLLEAASYDEVLFQKVKTSL